MHTAEKTAIQHRKSGERTLSLDELDMDTATATAIAELDTSITAHINAAKHQLIMWFIGVEVAFFFLTLAVIKGLI